MELFHGDCLDVLPKLIGEGVTVDLIIIDPPYLMNYYSKCRKDRSHDFCKTILNDDNASVITDVLPLLYSILKEGGAFYCFCNSNHIDFFKSEISKYFNYRNILVWVKNNHTGGDIRTTYAKKTEFIVYASKGRHELYGRRDTDVLFYDKIVGKRQLHQNQKPVDLLEFLIGKSSEKNEIILDCFMGSGSTGVACHNMGREFIGVELDENYYNIAVERLKENDVQKKLI